MFEELPVGAFVYVLAKDYGEDWASDEFGDEYQTKQIVGRIELVTERRIRGVISYDYKLRFFNESLLSDSNSAKIISWTMSEPSIYRNPHSVNEEIEAASEDSISEASSGDSNDDPEVGEPAAAQISQNTLTASHNIHYSTMSTSISDDFQLDASQHIEPRLVGYDEEDDPTPGDIFRLLMPKRFFNEVVIAATNEKLRGNGLKPTTYEEILKFFGALFAMTLFNFAHRSDFWSTSSRPLQPALNFAQYGISRARFNAIMQSLRFKPDDDAETDEDESGVLTPSDYAECEPLIGAFNSHMREVFHPGSFVCVDESMSMWSNRWTAPLWHYVPRKPTPMGFEFHDLACGDTGVIFNLELVGSVEHDKRIHSKMAAMILRLTQSAGIHNTNRVVIGDSAFPTLELLGLLRQHGLHGVFAVKKKRSWPKGIPGDLILGAVQGDGVEYGTAFAIEGKVGSTPFYVAGLLFVTLIELIETE